MMEGIVLQLQREALDSHIDVETLLRKAYLVAYKLQLKEFVDWVSSEQNGYKGKIPDYRTVSGEIWWWNPHYGWVPVIFQSKEFDFLSKMPIGLPISAISGGYKDFTGETTLLSIPLEIADLLNKGTSLTAKYAFAVSKAELYKIFSAVRNNILRWSLLLEQNGIVGDGLSFPEAEVKKAQESPAINNFTNNFYSNTDNVQIQQGGKENTQEE